MKAAACSGPWGVALLAADGVHEEALTLYPHRLQLENAKQGVDFDAAGGFHTYRLEIEGTDVRLFADGKMLLQGKGKFTAPARDTPPRNQCGFGCFSPPETGEATWQWVRCRGGLRAQAAPMLFRIAGFSVTLQTLPIASCNDFSDVYFKQLVQFHDGPLALGNRRSRDGGRTWTKAEALGVCTYQFPDGEIISAGCNTKKLGEGVFEATMMRSTDGGKTFKSEPARLNIPQGTGGTGDDGKYYEGPTVDHAIVPLRDGSLLMAMYGYFKTDTVVSPAFPPKWKFYKYRTWVMRSTDRGRNWDYRATVAYDPAVGSESFCEPDLLRLPDGDILCFMRTGGCAWPKYITPLYMNVSKDDGKIWSKPAPILDRGVWPSACRMQSGALAVASGRPDDWLALSRDEGKTWSSLCFSRGGCTTSYNGIAEVAPGKLLVVYDRDRLNADGDGNATRWIFGVLVDVKAE